MSSKLSAETVVDLKSSHEEADTLLILYGTEIHKTGYDVHIYASDTDVMVLAIAELSQLGHKTSIITGTGIQRRTVKLKPIYDALGENKVHALRGFHAISGCDTTGHIYGTSKTTWWKSFIKSNDKVIISLTELGKGLEPTEEVLAGCAEFIWQVLRVKKTLLFGRRSYGGKYSAV